MEAKTKKDVYQIVTDRIVAKLEQGVVPWKQNWHNAGMPMNLSTLKSYRGINAMLLASLGYLRNFFLTRNQLLEFGGTIKQGEKPSPVVYWKTFDEESEDEEPRRKPVLRYYSVYNIEQCDGIRERDIPTLVKDITPIEHCERVVANMPDKPKILYSGGLAFYCLPDDYVNMPLRQSFKDSEAHYETLFHELIHSTGHPQRLNRKEMADSAASKISYATEELTAEIGSCFLKSITGIDGKHFDNNVAYIQGWLKALKNDNRIIVFASTHAQKAVDFILGIKPEKTLKEEKP